MAWGSFDIAKFHLIRFAIVKYTSKSDKKIGVPDWLNDWLTDICIPRAAFAAEKLRLDNMMAGLTCHMLLQRVRITKCFPTIFTFCGLFGLNMIIVREAVKKIFPK